MTSTEFVSQRAERDADGATRRLVGEATFYELLATRDDIDPTLETLCTIVESLRPGVAAAVLILDRGGRVFEQAIAPSLGESYCAGLRGATIDLPLVGTCAAAVYRGEAVVSMDVANDVRWLPAWRELSEAHGVRACRSTPVIGRDGTPLGSFVLAFFSPLQRESEGDNLAAWAARLAAAALERGRRVAAQRLLVDELDHRTKNALALVQAIAQSTLARSKSLASFGETFMKRIGSLAGAQALLRRSLTEHIGLEDLLRAELAPHLGADGRIQMSGPAVGLGSNAVTTLALVVHELATNAVKYGALSVPAGRLSIEWRLIAEEAEERVLQLEWRESGGPVTGPASSAGFGLTLIRRGLTHDLDGSAELDFRPAGLCCRLTAPYYRLVGARRD
jgi:two-component sensor histidine kinase